MSKQSAFRGCKSYVSQNVLVACDFDMLFTFVYTRLEGTTNDSHVFMMQWLGLLINFQCYLKARCSKLVVSMMQ